MGPFAQTNTNLKCHLSSPPKVKVWISAFVLFQKVDIQLYVHEMFPLLRAHHSRLFYQSGQYSRDAALDHRRVLEDSSLGKGKSKGRFYIAQSFTLFALPFYSNTNSASPGSTPTMRQLRVTTKSLTFLSLSISCCRNRCRNSVTGMPYSVHDPKNGKRCLLCWCHTFQCNNMKMSSLPSCVQYGM